MKTASNLNKQVKPVGTPQALPPTNPVSNQNRILPIVLGVILFLTVIAGGIYFVSSSKRESSVSQLAPKTSTNNKGLALIYGAVSTTEEKYFKVSMDGQTKTEIPITNNEIDNIYDELSPSKDGKYLAHRTTKNVEVASVEQLSMFNNIVTIPDENRVIGSLAWASDGTKLVYTITNKPGYPPFVPPTLYTVDRNGSNAKIIDTRGAIFIGQLLAFNASANQVYALAQILLSTPKNAVLVSINLLDGSYKQLIDDEVGLTLVAPIISPDFTKAYNIIDMNQLVEYDLTNKTRRVIYSTQDKIKLSALQISSMGDSLTFLQFNDVQPSKEEKENERGSDLYLFNLQNNKPSILLNKKMYSDLASAIWSPDGNYLLITTLSSELLMNLKDKKLSSVQKVTNVDTTVRFLTWTAQ